MIKNGHKKARESIRTIDVTMEILSEPSNAAGPTFVGQFCILLYELVH